MMAGRGTITDRIKGDYIVRFGVHQRIQHALMFSSFAILTMTGMPLKYSGWASSRWWMGVWGGIENVRAVHRFAAWVMIAVCIYHLAYLLFAMVALKRPFPWGILPRSKDIRDFVLEMKHTFGLSKDTPKFDRFSYRNKGAYWLAFVGAFIMIGSGLMLLYPVWTANRLAGWMNPLALVIHSDAAILAVGWMVIVHMYFANLTRHTFPLDKSIFTGKVPINRYREEFPLEYEKIMAAAGVPLTAAEMAAPAIAERADVAGPLA